MCEVSRFKSCSVLPKEQNCVNHRKPQPFLHHSFMHGNHAAYKEHMENNPVHQNFYGSLQQGIELTISGRWKLSDVAPTLIILLKNGAKWDCPDLLLPGLLLPGMMTPYHVISRSPGDLQELLELMIKELGRSLLNAKDDDGCTALMYAVRNSNIQCVKCLIANGADVNLINDKPKRKVSDIKTGVLGPLIDSIKLLHPDSRYSYNTMMGIFDLLLDSGADVNKPCLYQNRKPIMHAAAVGIVSCCEKLIQRGAQFYYMYTDREGETLWSLAARTGSVDVLKCLLQNHSIDKNSTFWLNVLCCVVHSGTIEAVRYLLKQGVTVTSLVPKKYVQTCRKCATNILCYYDNTTEMITDHPYVHAIESNKLDVVRLMDEHGYELYKSPEILSHAILKNSVDVVEYLLCNYKYPLNHGYTVRYKANGRLKYGHKNFLIKACETQSVEVVKVLLERNADPNKNCCKQKCPSVINVAIYKRHVEIIARFIRGGVNVNTRSCHLSMGMMLPLEVAVYDNHIYAAEMLPVAGCSHGVHSLKNNCALKDNIGHKMQELLKEWNVHKNNVQPLKQRCRMVILNHLCHQADKKIKELPLPSQMIRYLSIPELDDILETFKCKPLTTYSYVK